MLRKLNSYMTDHSKYRKSRYFAFLLCYDMNRFLSHGGKDQTDGAALAGRIRLIVHALEKGLSVADGSREFGVEKARELVKLMDAYRASDMPDLQALPLAESVLRAYRDYRKDKGEDVSFLPEYIATLPAGAVEYQAQPQPGFGDIAYARHSVRRFGVGGVEEAELRQAVALAQTAPSACNRQSSRVYACVCLDKIKKIMAVHGGTRGFVNTAAVLVLTGDLRLYTNEYERHTVYVDGGIFLMNLLYSLQSVGLAACPIIWGSEPDNDDMIYKMLNIPKREQIVALVMVGRNPEEKVKIPVSCRRDTEDVLTFIAE
jgi:nitroreductase